ncbi:MAG: hypothetical protein M3017_05600 [Actinomycetota bacterium]|nr:hypothetical protein [Actinomycetota bacterium]
MTTTSVSRQPVGTPVGGQFATHAHGVADVSLSPASGPTVTDRFMTRDETRARRARLQQQLENQDRIYQHESLQLAAGALLAKYPHAVTLRVWENQDGENNYDPISLANADGGLIEDIQEDDDWIREEPPRMARTSRTSSGL